MKSFILIGVIFLLFMGAFSQSKVNTRKDIRLKQIKRPASDYNVIICDEDMSYFYHKKGCDRLYYCSRQFIEIRLSEAKKKDKKIFKKILKKL